MRLGFLFCFVLLPLLAKDLGTLEEKVERLKVLSKRLKKVLLEKQEGRLSAFVKTKEFQKLRREFYDLYPLGGEEIDLLVRLSLAIEDFHSLVEKSSGSAKEKSMLLFAIMGALQRLQGKKLNQYGSLFPLFELRLWQKKQWKQVGKGEVQLHERLHARWEQGKWRFYPGANSVEYEKEKKLSALRKKYLEKIIQLFQFYREILFLGEQIDKEIEKIEAAKRGKEKEAIQFLRKIFAAQMQFRLMKKKGNNYADFHELLQSKLLQNVGKVISPTRIEKEGYVFQLELYRAPKEAPVSSFSVVAFPKTEQAGRRAFYLDQNGIIRYTVYWPGRKLPGEDSPEVQ